VSGERHCDLLPFLLDILDFVIEQIELARSDADRAAALDAASGAVPLLNSRAWENQSVGAVIALSPLEPWLFSPHWQENWINLAKEPSDQFAKSADALIERLRVVQAAMQNIGRP
jgi:hypothetical protein